MFVSKWHMHRMGLIDFWYYVNEEFLFKDGHMLLRGSNGSGKSVTMQSFIPLLLDGNKSSERLDSFGTRSRKIENYLLEEDSERDDRIGYLYLEFKREDADVYKTIGMGLHARKNKPVDAWYFVIEDNRRINIDIHLMDHNLAITKQVLKHNITTQLIENQKEYMDRVNAALFGFSSRDEYKEAIALLMQLRSPKLSNSLKPTMINEILSESLQPLSEDDLRPMSEAISNMDEIKDQLDALKQSYTSAKTIASIYEQYNFAVLEGKARTYLQEERKFLNLQKDIVSLQSSLAFNHQKEEESRLKLQHLRSEQALLEEEKDTLVAQDILQLVEDVERHKGELQKQEQSLKIKEQQEEEKDNQRIDVKKDLREQLNKKDILQQDLTHIFEEMDDLQSRIQFEEHSIMQGELFQHLEREYDFSFTKKRIHDEQKSLQEGLDIFQKVGNLKKQQQIYVNEQESLETQKEKDESILIQLQQLFSEIQEEYKEKFAKWNSQNNVLKLDEGQLHYIIQQLQLFEVEQTYGEIETLIHTIYFKKHQQLSTARSEQDQLLKQMNTMLLQTQKELDEWINITEPKPDIDIFMSKNRELLNKKNIAFLPFYRLLDYEEDIAKQDRDNFEEMLLRSGLLNAIVVHESDKQNVLELADGTADYYVFSNHPIDQYDVFTIPKDMAKKKELTSLLKRFDFNTTSLSGNQQFFTQGILTGTISQEVETKYIGKQSRERYRQKKIAELKILIQEHESEKKIIYEKLENIDKDILYLQKEYDNYPKKEDLESAKQDTLQKEKDIENLVRRIQNVLALFHEKEVEVLAEKKLITDIATQLGISTSEKTFLQRKEDFQTYNEYLQSFIQRHTSFISAHEISEVKKNILDTLTEDLDVIKVEIEELQSQVSTLVIRIKQKENQLENTDYIQIKKRMEEIQLRLHELPSLISEQDRSIGNISTAISTLEGDIRKKQSDAEMQLSVKDVTYDHYVMEAQLNYVVEEDFSNVDEILRIIDLRFPVKKRKDNLANDLQTSFHVHRGVLQEYNLSMFSLFGEQEETARLDINARYQGIRISFPKLLDNLQKDIEKQSILLEDNDRALIEDILVNTISKKIRVHIQSSKRWVEIMNRYMNAMNTSSGLRLNLQWKSHKAENEEELSSEKLVELLEKDVKILKEMDRKHLSSHFRSKIASARKIAEQQDNHESFHLVMKQIMDYRNWFDFRILSQKTGEKKKELTNNAFYAFSGGEKAMAMYIPLFSATAAKFEGARADAPLLIALDEAFAGVDEKNINNMFELIGKFKFDYIMNSQVLWGDYPSVKSLFIHELFRPENARFVSVISYEWNGFTKVMVER